MYLIIVFMYLIVFMPVVSLYFVILIPNTKPVHGTKTFGNPFCFNAFFSFFYRSMTMYYYRISLLMKVPAGETYVV